MFISGIYRTDAIGCFDFRIWNIFYKYYSRLRTVLNFFRGIVGLLKYWALDETVPIMQTFKRMFLNKICLNLDSNFSAFCLNWQQLSIGLGNGSVSNRRQAITRYPKQYSPRSVMSQDVSRPLWAKTNRGSSRLCEIRRFMWCWSSPLDP